MTDDLAAALDRYALHSLDGHDECGPDCEVAAVRLALPDAAYSAAIAHGDIAAALSRPAPAPEAGDDGIYLLHFEDADRSIELFGGAGARVAAFRRFEQSRTSWNCTLFAPIAASGTDAEAPLATPSPEPRPSLDVERLARAIHGDPAAGCPPGDECVSPSRHVAFASRLDAEYARLSAEETQPDAEPPACQVIVSASGLARCETHGVAVITAEDFRIHGALSAEEPQP